MTNPFSVAVIIPRPGFHEYMAPLGYLYVVSAIKDTGIDVKVLNLSDSSINKNITLRQFLEKEQPNLVISGTSYKFHNNCPSSSIESALEIVKTTKELFPDCTTMLIGPLNALLYETLLENSFLDCVGVGEPEDISSELALALRNKKEISSIGGIATQKIDKLLLSTPRDYPDPNILLPPDRKAIDFEKYITDSYFAPRSTELLSSRGCPFNCTYCFGARSSMRNACNDGRSFRANSPSRVVDEIEDLYYNYGVRGIKFADVEFCVSKSRVKDICNELLAKALPDLRWRAVTHATSVEPELLELMYNAGCRNIYYGVESGDPEMLAIMNKSITPERVEKTFADTWAAKIKPEASFLLGVPGETEQSAERTIQFALKLKPFLATFHVFVPFPGIPMEKELKSEKGRGLDSWDVYKLNQNISYCDIPAEKLDKLCKQAYRRFYLRPSVLFNISKGLKEPSMRLYLIRLLAGYGEGGWFRKMFTGG